MSTYSEEHTFRNVDPVEVEAILQEARRMRAEYIASLFAKLGRSIRGAAGAVTAPVAQRRAAA